MALFWTISWCFFFFSGEWGSRRNMLSVSVSPGDSVPVQWVGPAAWSCLFSPDLPLGNLQQGVQLKKISYPTKVMSKGTGLVSMMHIKKKKKGRACWEKRRLAIWDQILTLFLSWWIIQRAKLISKQQSVGGDLSLCSVPTADKSSRWMTGAVPGTCSAGGETGNLFKCKKK